MADYQLTASKEPCVVLRAADNASIPPDKANRDYVDYLAWCDAGNRPDPYVEPSKPKPSPTQEEQVLFDHENRLRSLEGQPSISLHDFQNPQSPKASLKPSQDEPERGPKPPPPPRKK